jgi:hypothetical protein
MQCSNNINQIGPALLNYESAYKAFLALRHGNPLGGVVYPWPNRLNVRFALLPLLEQGALSYLGIQSPIGSYDEPLSARSPAKSSFLSAVVHRASLGRGPRRDHLYDPRVLLPPSRRTPRLPHRRPAATTRHDQSPSRRRRTHAPQLAAFIWSRRVADGRLRRR